MERRLAAKPEPRRARKPRLSGSRLPAAHACMGSILAFGLPVSVRAEGRPNFIFIFTDDQGRADLSAHDSIEQRNATAEYPDIAAEPEAKFAAWAAELSPPGLPTRPLNSHGQRRSGYGVGHQAPY